MTSLVKKHPVEDRMERVRVYEPGLPRGQGGHIGHLILGGMETTLDEMEYLLQRYKEERRAQFTPRRSNREVADMCRLLLEMRNDRIRHYQRNPSEAPRAKKSVRLHLPVGYRLAETSEPGLKIVARI